MLAPLTGSNDINRWSATSIAIDGTTCPSVTLQGNALPGSGGDHVRQVHELAARNNPIRYTAR